MKSTNGNLHSRIIEHPEEALEIDVERILENQRVDIGSTF